LLTLDLDFLIPLCSANCGQGDVKPGSMVTQHHTKGSGGSPFFLVPGNSHTIEIGSVEEQSFQFRGVS
jgi:hypothetical protein